MSISAHTLPTLLHCYPEKFCRAANIFALRPSLPSLPSVKHFGCGYAALRVQRLSRSASDFGTKMKILKTESFSTSTLQERFWDNRPIFLIHPLITVLPITDYLPSPARLDTVRATISRL